MNKLYIFLVLLLMINKVSYTQNLFYKTYGHYGNPSLSLVSFDKSIFMTSQGNSILIALKTDSLGNKLWSKEIKIPNSSSIILGGISQSMDSGYLILANIRITSISSRYLTVIKIDSSGNFLWSRSYYSISTNNANDIIRNKDNGFMIIGSGCNGNSFVIKCDQNGDIIWQKQYTMNGTGTPGNIASHDFNHFVISGYNNFDLTFFKIDTLGNLFWHTFITINNLGICTFSLKPANDGGYIATGQVRYDTTIYSNYAYIAKIKFDGNLNWLRVYSGSNETIGRDVIETSDNKILMVGGNSFPPYLKAFVIITNQFGNVESANYETLNNFSEYHSINIFSESKLLVSGVNYKSFISMADNNLESHCNNSSFDVLQLNPVTSKTFVSYTPSVLTFKDTSLLLSYSDKFLFIDSMCQNTSILETTNFKNEIKIFPNPFTEQAIIQTNKSFQNVTLTIYNSFGQQIKQINNIYGESIVLHRDNLPMGIYYFYLSDGNINFDSGKFLIIDY